MVYPNQRSMGLHFNSQLFPYFPLERLAQALTRFDLASRKFPKPALVRLIGSLAEQNSPLFILDYRYSDLYRFQVRYSAFIRTYSCERSQV